jgi:septal ring factor EnvC (AmiA/AmiB activator)
MKQIQGLTAEMYQAIVAIMDDRLEATRVTRRDYNRLADGQDRIESRMDRVEATLDRLAEAQARSEERVGRLDAALVHSGGNPPPVYAL